MALSNETSIQLAENLGLSTALSNKSLNLKMNFIDTSVSVQPNLNPEPKQFTLTGQASSSELSKTVPALETQTIQPNLSDQLSNSQITVDPNNIVDQKKCDYCNRNFSSDEIEQHIADCDKRKIRCEKCHTRVYMDTYEDHFQECDLSEGAVLEDDDDNVLDEEMLTYENLLMLDATIVKVGMTPEQLKAFPIQLYVKSLDGKGYCCICMSNYETGEYIRKLSCEHKYHKECIDEWLKANITCPFCKKELR